MGSCISKFKPKKKSKKDYSHDHVHDKLVISQDPPISSIPTNITAMPSKNLTPATSTSSTLSSFSCSTNSKFTIASSVSSSSSSSSCSSRVLNVKDRSFSNEFLWSCVKDNPQIVGVKEKSLEKTILYSNKILDPSSPKVKQPIQEKATPKKRARASSPTLVKQKSFRKDQNSMPDRGLRSPSPSRRFDQFENSCRRQVVSKGSSPASCLKRESFRTNPNSDLSISRNFSVRKKDTFSQQISRKIDGRGEMDIVMEDIDNPLIALDCFIFL